LLACGLDDMSFLKLQIGDPIEARHKEWTERGSSVDQLVYCINSFREAASSSDQKFDHIDISEKQKVGQNDILSF
jgi:heat shock 70kDa protein 4